MKPTELRKVFKALNDTIGTCPTCGKSRMIKATSWRGHGTGHHGQSTYEAKSFEKVSPATHCTCPGGPVWMMLEPTAFGRTCKLVQGFQAWSKRDENFRREFALFWYPDAEPPGWYQMPLANWNVMLTENWDKVINYEAEA